MSKTTLCFVELPRWQHQLDVSQQYYWVKFLSGITGGKFVVCDCTLVKSLISDQIVICIRNYVLFFKSTV